MNYNKLKQLIEQILSEELAVDSPSGGLLGKVAFADRRTDKVEPEKNTKIEDEIFDAINAHIDDNQSQKLAKAFDVIYQIAQNKNYSLLTPEPGYVYRIIFGVDLKRASNILNKSVEELSKADSAKYTRTNGTIETIKEHKGGIQSWTANPQPDVLKRFGAVGESVLNEKNPMVILMRAQVPSGGKFILNPSFTKRIKDLKFFADEEEVVSKGPVNLIDASYIRFVPNPKEKVFSKEDNQKFQEHYKTLNKNQNSQVVFKLLSDLFEKLLRKKTNLDINKYSLGVMIKYNTKTGELKTDLNDITYGDLFSNGVVESLIDINLTEELLKVLKNGNK